MQQRLEALMGAHSQVFTQLRNSYPLPHPEVWDVPPKISKGEQYEGLPWLMLDYPRFFRGNDHFAIRTFFWWGRFAGIYWHTAGKFASEAALQAPRLSDWEQGYVRDPYRYAADPANMLPSAPEYGTGFYRAARRYEVAAWICQPELVRGDYDNLLAIISQGRMG